MDKIENKNKIPTELIETYEQIDGRKVMLELLNSRGVEAFPDSRFVPIKYLIEKALIHYGLTFNRKLPKKNYRTRSRKQKPIHQSV